MIPITQDMSTPQVVLLAQTSPRMLAVRLVDFLRSFKNACTCSRKISKLDPGEGVQYSEERYHDVSTGTWMLRRLGYRLSIVDSVPQSATAMPFCAPVPRKIIRWVSQAEANRIRHSNSTYPQQPTLAHVLIPFRRSCIRLSQRTRYLDTRTHPSPLAIVVLPREGLQDGCRIALGWPRYIRLYVGQLLPIEVLPARYRACREETGRIFLTCYILARGKKGVRKVPLGACMRSDEFLAGGGAWFIWINTFLIHHEHDSRIALLNDEIRAVSPSLVRRAVEIDGVLCSR